MTWIRVAQWAIRIVLVGAFFGIVVIILYPSLNTGARINGIGAALELAGIAFTIPELAQRLSDKPATDLIIWADTFMPLWAILSKIRRVKTLGQLSVFLSIMGVLLVVAGLGLQYLASYFTTTVAK